jgi:hypothetical protein
MSTTTRTCLLLTAAAAALALTGGAAENASAADSVERATKLLQGKRVTVYISHKARTDSNVEHRIDFCPRGRVFVKSTFHWIARVVRRGRGHWRVVSARIRRGVGRAKLTLTGWPTHPTVRSPRTTGKTLKVVLDRRGARMLGHRAEITRSPAC